MYTKNNEFNKIRKALPIISYGGFTLIELLVSIVIIGALAATALPSYLNQAAKARGSEAKSRLGAINRAQQAYRWENNTFADNLSLLDIKVDGKFYSYSMASANVTDAKVITSSKQDGLKISSGGVTQNGDKFLQIVCESSNIYIVNTSAVEPTGGGGTSLTCPSGYSLIN
jgi:type IV pilus assembly protein PilA